MVQLPPRSARASQGRGRERVELCVVGPKSIIPRTVTVDTCVSNTWLTFFVEELELNVPYNEGIFICNSSYCPSSPKEGEGWRCELNEPISNYVNQFERRRNRYTVRICRPSDFTGKRGRVSSRTPRARSCTPAPNGRHRNTKSTPGNRGQRSRSVANSRSLSPPRHRQPSILIPTTTTSVTNGNAKPSGVLTPRSQQSHYGTRLKRLHDQSTLQLESQQSSPEIPSKRQRNVRKQIIVPRLAAPEPAAIAIVKQEESQVEDGIPQINDVRSILKIEVPSTSTPAQFYDETDEMETDVSSSAGGDSVSDSVNGLGGRDPGLVNVHVEDEQGEQQREEGEIVEGDEFGTMSDSSTEEDESWARGDEEAEDDDDDDGMSMCTAVSQEEIQLRQEGIRVEDVKSVAKGRFENFSNSYMLRVKNEIHRLKKNNLWVKSVEKSPLACFLLQEVFK